MNITTTINGTFARITPSGDIDADTLAPLRAAADVLPPHVSDLQWDLRHAFFMDVAGLHLLLPQQAAGPTRRHITVVRLHPQPARLLAVAADLRPEFLALARLLPAA
ncbi:STAS domain-containing protein [Streptomyces sp. NPDC057249]|uniref:STAS domain-containing protein n=1 Tax=Streptomyces sp. NPDC057249 TaxID=3346067 RepID=UPI003641C1DD